MKQLLSAVLLSVTLTACGGGGGGGGGGNSGLPVIQAASIANPTPSTVTMNCEQLALVKAGNYYAFPNSWNRGSITNYTNCIGLSPNGSGVVADTKYNWPYQPNDPNLAAKAYPTIIYGLHPTVTGSNGVLPKLLSQINNVPITWDVTRTGSDPNTGVLFFDTWLSTNANPARFDGSSGVTVSLGITLGVWGALKDTPAWKKDWRDGSCNCGNNMPFPIVTIDGEEYFLQVDGSNFGGPNYYDGKHTLGISFTRVNQVTDITQGQINLKSFINHLVNNNTIPANLYLMLVEFGTELGHGQGEIKYNNYNVSVE